MATAGFKGEVKYGTDSSENAIGGVKSCSVNMPRDMLETTEFSAAGSPVAARSYVAGLYGIEITIEVYREDGDTAQDALRANWKSGTAASLLIDFDASSSFSADLDMATVLVENIDTSEDVEGLVMETYTLRASGDVTIA